MKEGDQIKDAIIQIRDYCNITHCSNCKYLMDDDCMFRLDYPKFWFIEEEYVHEPRRA